MKEIVNRLHENRQIQLAKLILENAGYKVEKKLNESADVQYGVHQFSTDSIVFRGSEEECGRYIDKRKDLWDDAEIYRMTPDDPHYKKEVEESCIEGDSEDVNESIVSSLQKDVMRAVNELAPSAMAWREGHEIRHTKTDVVGEFKGYKKNPITGKYTAIITTPDEIIKYPLEDMQADIEAGILINLSLRK